MIDYAIKHPDKWGKALLEHMEILVITMVISIIIAVILTIIVLTSGMGVTRFHLCFFHSVFHPQPGFVHHHDSCDGVGYNDGNHRADSI
ncbi:hypothetical protein Q0F98_36985 [Paenibacillus amylolyticus]|nr:hypothetical protein Q0F98_36985 [Paenibacillus amylolyticus]